MSAATIVNDLRTRADLSARALARRAQTATTTITRAENDTLEPTLAMLQRIANAAGYTLDITPRPIPTLASAAATSAAADEWKDWTPLRAVADWTDQHPSDAAAAIAAAPDTTNQRALNLLAAIAETIADAHRIPAPGWAAGVRALDAPWRAGRRPTSVSGRFAARNVHIPTGSIWHERTAT